MSDNTVDRLNPSYPHSLKRLAFGLCHQGSPQISKYPATLMASLICSLVILHYYLACDQSSGNGDSFAKRYAFAGHPDRIS